VKPFYHPKTLYWDANNIRQILEGRGLSQGAINLLKNFFPLAGQNLYESYIDYVQELYSADLSYLYEIPGGIARLPAAFYNSTICRYPAKDYPAITPNALGRVTWKTGTRAEGIYLNSDGKAVILGYGNKENPGRLYEQFDYVVCAIPFSTLRTIDIQPLFSSLKMQAIREVNYINAQKTFVLFSKRFWEEGGPGVQIVGGASYTDLPVTQIYYPSDHAQYCVKKWTNIPGSTPSTNLYYGRNINSSLSKEPGVLLASYSFNIEATRLANMPCDLRFEEIKRELEMVHGLPKGYLDPIAIAYKTVNWDDEEWFRGALCFYSPEQKRLFSCAAATPEYNNRVFFAGEHISAKHRWMQGSLKSGMEAANALALACKLQQHQ